MTWLIIGIILCAWALLNVLGGERQRGLARRAQMAAAALEAETQEKPA